MYKLENQVIIYGLHKMDDFNDNMHDFCQVDI